MINIDYIKLFSGKIEDIVPEFTKECNENSVWHEFSDYVRNNHSQDMIKSAYLIILDSFIKDRDLLKMQDLLDKYQLHLDILWYALSDENCAKIELHIK